MILKDQKTSSTSEEPKVKSALLNKYEEDSKKEEDGYERLKTKESNKLPKPTGWRLVVLPFKMKEKTKGGLIHWTRYFRKTTSRIYLWFSSCYGTTLL